MTDLVRGLKALDAHRPAYVIAEKMFKGTAREVAANPEVRSVIQQTAEYYKANFAKKPVKARTNRLKVAALQVAGEEGDTRPLTQRLEEEIAEPNEFDIELPRWIEMVCEYGDAYLLRWPAEMTDAGDPAKVHVFVRNPKGMRAMYDTENEREIEYVIDTWCVGDDEDERLRVNLYYPGRIERFVSIDKPGKGVWDDSMFLPFDERKLDDDEEEISGDGPVITHDWGMPIVHGRTGRPYGLPVHYDAYGPQNAITKIMATHLAGIDWNGWPWRYQLSKSGTTGSDLNDWDDDNREAPNPHRRRSPIDNAPIQRRASQKLRNAPGTMNKLHNVDAVGQLDGATPDTFLAPLVAYANVLGEVTDTPMNVMNPTGQVESGQSRMARIDDLLAGVEMLKIMLAGPIASTCEGALAMLGVPDQTVTVTWAPSMKISDTAGWESVTAQQTAGVPVRDTLIEAGYLPEQVDAWEDEIDGKLTMIEKIATAGTALGQAVQLLGLPADNAAQLFGQLIMETIQGDEGPADDGPAA